MSNEYAGKLAVILRKAIDDQWGLKDAITFVQVQTEGKKIKFIIEFAGGVRYLYEADATDEPSLIKKDLEKQCRVIAASIAACEA